ncbi:TetR/AcrR family transcriptional regulator [Brachybacterium alimentarium]|uniref:TetR/AcrR family transcriptional regulator n=1 Tax=Brachybacterium alimentarium TaxID=47845 RepID=UPI003FD27575
MSTAAHDGRSVRRRPGRPRGQDSAVVREAALRAAIDLIARQGFAATSMAQVAAAAGISPSGLAHHFSSKKALLGAVLDHRDAADSDPRAAFGDGPWADFEHLTHVAQLNQGRRQLVHLYTTMIGEAATAEHPAHEWMLGHYSVVVGMLVDGIRAAQREGHVRADAPAERIARTTVALMDGLQVQWLLDPEIDMGAAMAEHVDELKQKWSTAGA